MGQSRRSDPPRPSCVLHTDCKLYIPLQKKREGSDLSDFKAAITDSRAEAGKHLTPNECHW